MKYCLILAALLSTVHAYSCYNQKCKNYDGSYITCDQEYYDCTEGNTLSESATCTYTGTGDTWNYVICWQDDSCQHDSWTGEASCDDFDDLVDAGLNIVYIIIIACASGTVALVILCCCCCYCINKSSQGTRGRVLPSQPAGGAVQPAPKLAPQYQAQPAPQYQAQPAPQYQPQPAPQYHHQPAPQYNPQHAPQPVPQYQPQPVPQYQPQPPSQYPQPPPPISAPVPTEIGYNMSADPPPPPQPQH